MNALPESTGVLVVGAGPAGLSLAASLRQKGVDAVLLDRAAEGANTSRAAVVHARTLETLREVGATGELVERGIIVPRFTVRERDRVLLTVEFGDLPTDFPYTLLVPQNVTEEILLGRLHAAGGVVHRPFEVTGLEQDEDGVTATLADGGQIRAAYAVGTDGMHSTVREHAGIAFEGDAYPQSFVLADVHLDWAAAARRSCCSSPRRVSRSSRRCPAGGTASSRPSTRRPGNRPPPTSRRSWTRAAPGATPR
ncbi:FAD-dependent oxidoreductase [Actinomadura luteofluorescens]|uniref:FAD-dependent oxidoreductase n=1 Tax=Actinomadura luteofluorescens TaxID=46163 RepID=UPI0036416195